MKALHRVVSCVVVLAALLLPISGNASGLQQQQEIWLPDWFTDLPAVDLSGSWLFDAEHSDPMLREWAEGEVRYVINHQPAFIVLEFRAGSEPTNAQTYRWDGTIAEFQRGARQVQEAARWTRAGRRLEVVGRHWDPEEPEAVEHYRFTYEPRGDVLTFVQENESGRTVWLFVKEREPRPAR